MVESSSVSWTQTLNGGTITIETRVSTDDGVTWTPWAACTNGSAIPDLPSGTDVSTALLECRQTLSTQDPSVTPELQSLSVTVNSQKLHAATPTLETAITPGSLALAHDQVVALEASADNGQISPHANASIALDADATPGGTATTTVNRDLSVDSSVVNLESVIRANDQSHMNAQAAVRHVGVVQAATYSLQADVRRFLMGAWQHNQRPGNTWTQTTKATSTWQQIPTPKSSWSKR